jgi:hypothetical protein
VTSAFFHEYKNALIFLSATNEGQHGWRPLGIILDPDSLQTQEIKRLRGEHLYRSREEAETKALELCKNWIDACEER